MDFNQSIIDYLLPAFYFFLQILGFFSFYSFCIDIVRFLLFVVFFFFGFHLIEYFTAVFTEWSHIKFNAR